MEEISTIAILTELLIQPVNKSIVNLMNDCNTTISSSLHVM